MCLNYELSQEQNSCEIIACDGKETKFKKYAVAKVLTQEYLLEIKFC